MTARLMLVMAACLLAQAARADEHPAADAADQMEHPAAGASAKWCPLKDAGGSKAEMARIRKEYVAAVRAYVKTKAPFTVHDDKLGKDWTLKLVRVHQDRIMQLGDNQFFACSDFKSARKGGKDALDLDFFASKNPDGAWKIDKVLIHKVNGKPRYTWNAKNEMVPVKD
ncbi:MAG: hypothetical protein HKL90_14280 [Elusimicrobia bacterium]|nr:hypothetical protein [Elusimicrobiota bacterium]